MKYLMVHRAAEPSLMYAQGDSLKLKSAILLLWIFLLKLCLLPPLLLPPLPFLCLCAFTLSTFFHLSNELRGSVSVLFLCLLIWLNGKIRNRIQALVSSSPKKCYFLLPSEMICLSSGRHFETMLISASSWCLSCAISSNCM